MFCIFRFYVQHTKTRDFVNYLLLMHFLFLLAFYPFIQHENTLKSYNETFKLPVVKQVWHVFHLFLVLGYFSFYIKCIQMIVLNRTDVALHIRLRVQFVGNERDWHMLKQYTNMDFVIFHGNENQFPIQCTQSNT